MKGEHRRNASFLRVLRAEKRPRRNDAHVTVDDIRPNRVERSADRSTTGRRVENVDPGQKRRIDAMHRYPAIFGGAVGASCRDDVDLVSRISKSSSQLREMRFNPASSRRIPVTDESYPHPPRE